MEHPKPKESMRSGSSNLGGFERSTRSNAEQSGFLELSAELQHGIYELLQATRYTLPVDIPTWSIGRAIRIQDQSHQHTDYYSQHSCSVELDRVIYHSPNLEATCISRRLKLQLLLTPI